MRSDSATVLTETAHRSTNRAGRSGEGTQPAAGLAKPHGRGDPRVARSSLDPEHGRLYGVSTEPVQGLLVRVSGIDSSYPDFYPPLFCGHGNASRNTSISKVAVRSC